MQSTTTTTTRAACDKCIVDYADGCYYVSTPECAKYAECWTWAEAMAIAAALAELVVDQSDLGA